MIASEYIYTKMPCWSWNLFNGSTDNFRVYWDELAYLRTMDPYLQTGDVQKDMKRGGTVMLVGSTAAGDWFLIPASSG